MDGDSVFNEAGGKLSEVLVEALDHVRADSVGALTPRLPIGKRLQRRGADF